VLAVGSLSGLKQYDIFIEITAALKKKFPALKAVLAGDGEERERLKQLAEDYHLQKNLSMSGMLPPAEAIKLMQRAKIFLHPSSYEGFSMACLEALYAGAHVISFVKPMHHEIKNWHVVKIKEEMKQKALELLEKKNTLFEPVLVYTMDDSAAAMMNLLGSSPG
jgi:glycosyltransferase involved in cell wall biosynthesis